MRRVKVRIRVGRGSLTKEHHVSAYMTSVAGLVIHPEVEYDSTAGRFISKRNTWAITQYPTGLLAFGGIFTMQEAFDIVEKDMIPFNWVGLNADEAMAVNDAEELQVLANKVKEKIAMSRKIQQEARSK